MGTEAVGLALVIMASLRGFHFQQLVIGPSSSIRSVDRWPLQEWAHEPWVVMSAAYLKLGSFTVMFKDCCHLFLWPDMRHVLCGLCVCGFLFFCFVFEWQSPCKWECYRIPGYSSC